MFGIECEEVGAHGIIQNSRDLSGKELGAGSTQGNGGPAPNGTKRSRQRTALQGLKPASKTVSILALPENPMLIGSGCEKCCGKHCRISWQRGEAQGRATETGQPDAQRGAGDQRPGPCGGHCPTGVRDPATTIAWAQTEGRPSAPRGQTQAAPSQTSQQETPTNLGWGGLGAQAKGTVSARMSSFQQNMTR